jgi:hypothetical protein
VVPWQPYVSVLGSAEPVKVKAGAAPFPIRWRVGGAINVDETQVR